MPKFHEEIIMKVVVMATAFVIISLFSCKEDRHDRFRLEGTFVNFNAGELYVYSPFTTETNMDTIVVSNGKFVYEKQIIGPTTLHLLFPNYSQYPIFARPGAIVKLKADALNLKGMEITGTEENKLMMGFRARCEKMTPLETRKAVEDFVKTNPTSPVSAYLINRYFIVSSPVDYKKANSLANIMRKADPENGVALNLLQQTEKLKALREGAKLPQFSVKDIDSSLVESKQLKEKVNVITAWASWNDDSKRIQRKLYQLKKTYSDSLKIVSVCLDACMDDCIKEIKRDSINWPNICDGHMWDSPLLAKLGIATIPAIVIINSDSKIEAINLDIQQMEDKVHEIMKKPRKHAR